MSIARPLTGTEVKIAVCRAISEVEAQMQLEGANFAAEADLYLSSFSSLEGDHLVYPHVEWNLEGTIEKTPPKFGEKQQIWASITMDLDLGGGALISKRFGEAAPIGGELITQLFPLQQRSLRTPDVLRERWIQEQEPEPQAEPAPTVLALETKTSAPPPEAWNFVPDSLDEAPSPVGELPTLDSFDSDPDPEPKPSAPATAKRRGRPAKKGS